MDNVSRDDALFFFNDTATTEIYTLSLHDALPICPHRPVVVGLAQPRRQRRDRLGPQRVQLVRPIERQRREPPIHLVQQDRKSTRLNSSHANISYAVFCLKKKTFIPTRYSSLSTSL